MAHLVLFSVSTNRVCSSRFGDVHYFYGPETATPPHHRFDKGSYVYLFENANERRARIEIANRVGTDDQDAFDGCETQSPFVAAESRALTLTLSMPNSPGQGPCHILIPPSLHGEPVGGRRRRP